MKRPITFCSFPSPSPAENNPHHDIRRKRKTVSPSESVIRNLLSYSKALAVLNTTETGYINLVMN